MYKANSPIFLIKVAFIFILSTLLTSCRVEKVKFTNTNDINKYSYNSKDLFKNNTDIYDIGHGDYYFIIDERDKEIRLFLPDLYFYHGVIWDNMPLKKIIKLQKKIKPDERLWVKINCRPIRFNYLEKELMVYFAELSDYDFENSTIKLVDIGTYKFFIGPKLKVVNRPFRITVEIE